MKKVKHMREYTETLMKWRELKNLVSSYRYGDENTSRNTLRYYFLFKMQEPCWFCVKNENNCDECELFREGYCFEDVDYEKHYNLFTTIKQKIDDDKVLQYDVIELIDEAIARIERGYDEAKEIFEEGDE